MESVTGCQIFNNKCFRDNRGYFIEAYKKSEFPIPEIKQTNISRSFKGTVRGLHFQTVNPQGKLVRSLYGVILDVVVDLRVGSKTYGKKEEFLLQPDGISVYIPPGMAHGFWALEECVFHYGCTEEYNKRDCGISPVDSDLSLPWRDNPDIILSDKDKSFPKFKDFKSPFRMES